MSWDVDGVRITRVVEHVMPFPVDFFAEATREDVAAETSVSSSTHAPATRRTVR